MKDSAIERHSYSASKRRWTRMSPPLREPDSVGSTIQRCAPVSAAAVRTSASTRSRSFSATSSRRVTLYIAQLVHVARRGGHTAGPFGDQLRDGVPPRAERRVRSALPRHLPPRLSGGQRPRDGDGVGLIVEPDRRTDQDVAQTHAALAG